MEPFYLIAEVVIGLVLDAAGASDKVRDWLGRNPTKLAYERALARAYAAFVRGYPELAERFFDLDFLRGKAADELAKQLTPQDHPDAARLARLWGEYLYRDRASPERDKFVANERTVRACADFLRVLDAEIKSEPALRPLVDPKLLDEIQETTARTEGAVQELFERDLERALEYRALAEKFNEARKFFSGAFADLNDLYTGPEQVFQRVRVDEFVGREWLVAQVDEFLNDGKHSSGYMRIEGEAGVGKTSFLAHLVRERGYMHILNDELRGDNNVKRALLSLGAQIVSRYRMKGYEHKDYLPEVAGNTDYLWKLLDKARLELSAGEKIVVVCDALDEAGIGSNGNVYGLPSTLPENVFFIVTQRPVFVPLRLDKPSVPVRVRPADPDNIEDVCKYLRGAAHRPEIAQQLHAHHYTHEHFVETLTNKSEGVWIYLQFVLEEIRKGEHAPLKLDQLPNGLIGYYLGYWRDWRGGRNGRGKGADAWDSLYMPLLTTLAAAQEPVPLVTLLDWADVTANKNQMGRLLKEDWRAFVTERKAAGGPRFALYHASLRDFLTGDPVRNDLSKLTDADRGFLDELREGTAEAHRRIIGSFRERCRGSWTDLIHDDYARRYLTLHLEGAGEHDTLANLAAWNDGWAKARYGREEDWSGYLTDLDRVWQRAERDETFNVGWQIRCALLESTIHSLAGNVFPALLVQLVETRLWSPARALAHVAQMPRDNDKASALEKLGPRLPTPLLDEALAAARGIGAEHWRAEALSGLAGHLSPELLAEVLAAAREIRDEYNRARVLMGLAEHLPERERAAVVQEALAAVRRIQSGSARVRALSGLVGYLSEGERTAAVAEAMVAARGIANESTRVGALSELAGHLPEGERTAVVAEAMVAAREIRSEYSRAQALSGLVRYLPEGERTAVVQEALAAVEGIQSEDSRAQVLSESARHLPPELVTEALAPVRRIQSESARAAGLSVLVGHLPERERAAVVQEALAAVRGIQEVSARAAELSLLVGYLSEGERTAAVAEALAAAREIRAEYSRALLLSGLVGYLSEGERTAVVAEALTAVEGIQSESARAEALSELAGHLPEGERSAVVAEAMVAVREIRSEYSRAQALSGLVRYLPEGERTAVVAEALAAVEGIQSEDSRVQVLSELARHLPPELVAEALAAVEGIQSESVRAQALSDLARHLPSELVTEALATAEGIQSEYSRVRALSGLVGYLPEGERTAVVAEALATARRIQSGSARVRALSGLVGYLPEGVRTAVVVEAMVAAREIRVEYSRAQVLSGLVRHLPEGERSAVVVEALAAAQEIRVKYSRAQVLSGLVRYLPEDERTAVVAEAMAAVRGIQDEAARAQALSGLAEQLSPELLGEALTAARGIGEGSARARALSGLAGHLSPELLGEALTAAREIGDESARARALSGLAGHLPPELLGEALAAAREIGDESARAEALSGLARQLPEEERIELLPRLFWVAVESSAIRSSLRPELLNRIVEGWKPLHFRGLARDTWNLSLRALARNPRNDLLQELAVILPLVRHLGGQPVLNETFYAIRDVSRWWP